jgi:hypothetical protein
MTQCCHTWPRHAEGVPPRGLSLISLGLPHAHVGGGGERALAITGDYRGVGGSWTSAYPPDVSLAVGLRSGAREERHLLRIGGCNVRRIVIPVIALVVGRSPPEMSTVVKSHRKRVFAASGITAVGALIATALPAILGSRRAPRTRTP